MPYTLAYKDRFLETLDNAGFPEVTGEPVYFPDENTEIVIPFRVSQAQFRKLLTSVMCGADLLYPDESQIIAWWLWRVVGANMAICEEIAECIETSEAVSLALSKWISENYESLVNQASLTNAMSASEAENNLLPAGYTCDQSHLMGMAYWIRDNLHDTALEVIQELEVLTNPFELMNTLIDNIPILGQLAGLVTETIGWFQDNIIDTYSAAYTQVVADNIGCALYCQFEGTCTVSIHAIIEAYTSIFADASLTPPVSDNFQDHIDWLQTLTSMPDMIVVSAFHWIALQAIRFQTPFSVIAGIRTMEQLIQLGMDETSGDYVLCEPCNPLPPVVFTNLIDYVSVPIADYTNITITPIWGNQTLGEGWYGLQNPDGSGSAQWGYKMEILLDAPVVIDWIRLNFNNTWSSSQRRLWLYNGATLVRYLATNATISVPTFYTWNETGKWGAADKIILHTKLLSASAGRLTTVEFSY